MLLAGCFGWSVSAWAGQDEEAVQRAVTQAVSGTATFSESRDKQSVLMLYTDDYVGNQDGLPETNAVHRGRVESQNRPGGIDRLGHV